jgi:hypothetical protein
MQCCLQLAEAKDKRRFREGILSLHSLKSEPHAGGECDGETPTRLLHFSMIWRWSRPSRSKPSHGLVSAARRGSRTRCSRGCRLLPRPPRTPPRRRPPRRHILVHGRKVYDGDHQCPVHIEHQVAQPYCEAVAAREEEQESAVGVGITTTRIIGDRGAR